MKDFEEKLLEAVHQLVIKMAEKGDFVTVPYEQKYRFSKEQVEKIYSKIDLERISELVRAKVEEAMADKIVCHMITEISSDIKGVLSNKQIREDIRYNLRKMMENSIDNINKGLPELKENH